MSKTDLRLTAVAVAAFLSLPAPLGAHDIPNDITIQAFLKAEGQRLRLLVRVPLSAMRDIDYPRRDKEYVDLARADQALRDAATVWVARDVELYEGASRLPNPEVVAVRASLPSDEAFRSYETALSQMTARLRPDSRFIWNQGVLDVLLESPIQSDRAAFSIEPRWGRLGLRTVTALRFMTPGGAVRAFELVGDPGLVRLDPRWHQAAARFVKLGFFHILDGTDHLLFLLCLVIPFRRLRPLILIITSFTVAHSITLIAAAYDAAPGALWFPPLIETLIAMSIVYMALENIVAASFTRGRESTLEAIAGGSREREGASEASGGGAPRAREEDQRSSGREWGWGPTTIRRRWLITFGFGLVHGFGFSLALKETLQFAGSHLLTSLVSFNIGVELGQLLVIVLLVPALDLLFRLIVAERIGTIVLSALVAHTGWHWMTERADRLRQYSWQWPTITASLLLTAMRWLTGALVLAGSVWLVRLAWRHRRLSATIRSGPGVRRDGTQKEVSQNSSR